MSEAQVTQRPATEASIEQSRSPERQQSLMEFMQGDRNMSGGRFDMESRGISTDDPQPFQIDDPHTTVLNADSNTYAQEGFQTPQAVAPPKSPQDSEERNWKQLYGQSENEKGEWRRTAEEAQFRAGQLEQRLQQLESMVTQQQQTAAPVEPPRLFEKDPDELPTVAEVEQIMRQRDAYIYQQQQQIQYLAQAHALSLKAAHGITPQVEQEVATKYPWIASLPEGPQRIEAIRSLMPREQPQPTAPPQRPQPTPQQVQQAQNVARRVTYVEPSHGASPTGEHPSAQQLFEKELAAASQKPFMERRKAMQEVFHKYGITEQNDFRGGMVLTR